jgi:3-oxoadipate enol-lactonase
MNWSPDQFCVFLHGIGGSAKIWAAQEASFARAGIHPVALDLPGYGARPPLAAMDIEGLAEDAEKAIDERRLENPLLVGHSLGGMIVQTMLRRRPRGYRAAVLACTSPAFGNPSGDFQKKFIADRLAPLDAGKTMAELAEKFVDEMIGPNPDPAGRALAIACMGAVSAETYRASVHCLVGFDERDNLANIKVPVLCLAGEHDRNAPAPMMERMATKIPGARYVCLADVGHLPNVEAPRMFDKTILEFLREPLPSAGACEPIR